MKQLAALFVFFTLTIPHSHAADLKLHGLFGDNMILQRDTAAPVWGSDSPGNKVTVRFAGQTKSVDADPMGKWSIKLDPLPASSEPQPLEVASSSGESITIRDALVGDVWLCSGQSNMAMKLDGTPGSKEEIPAANHPGIRFFKVRGPAAGKPAYHLSGDWEPCSPQTAPTFSAVGYYFGKELHQKVGVPIGLIYAAEGGTPAEAWTSWEALKSKQELEPILANFQRELAEQPARQVEYEKELAAFRGGYAVRENEARQTGQKSKVRRPKPPTSPNSKDAPAALFNGRIHPLIPFGIKGVIWYQGEANAMRPKQYETLLPTLIADWRSRWAQGDFPFLIVQLPNYQAGSKPGPANLTWTDMREAQLNISRAVSNTGLAVTIDIGEADNLHPRNKRDVGLRLALLAREVAYGEDIVGSGPAYESMSVEDGRIKVRFSNVGSGLVAMDGGELRGFEVSNGTDFVPAKSEILPAEKPGSPADTIRVWNEEIAEPTAVRYAWAGDPVGSNLANKEKVLASPFRSNKPGQ